MKMILVFLFSSLFFVNVHAEYDDTKTVGQRLCNAGPNRGRGVLDYGKSQGLSQKKIYVAALKYAIENNDSAAVYWLTPLVQENRKSFLEKHCHKIGGSLAALLCVPIVVIAEFLIRNKQ